MKKKIMLMIGIIISLVTILSMYNISYADTCVHDWDYKNDSYHECLNCSLQVAHSLSWSGSATSEKHVMECSTCEYTTRRNHTASTPHFEANGGGANATHDVVTECSVCGYEMGRSENDCNFGSWAVSKTDYNKHYRSCNQCGYGYSADHSGTWTTTTYATCTTTGLKERYCSTCGHTNQQVISKLGHDYSEPCPTCGAADMICSRNSNHKIDHECHKHSYTSTVISYATCQETGEEKYTCSCGDSYTETIPKIPHDYSVNDYLYASTSQHYTKKCSMCSERSGLVSHTESTHFEALGGGANATHLVVTECTLCLGRLGSSEQECSFTEWELSNTDINEHYRYCTLCNYGYGEDHTYNVSSPTCTVAKYCTKCDYVAANALGHNYSLPCTACNTENVICSNNNSHELSHDCSIYVVPPTVTNHIWTGNTLRGVSTNENYTLSGNPTGLNVGVYTARATLKSGSKPTYRWNDTKTTEARDYSWTILDETIKITQHPTDVEVKSGETATFSVVATGTHLSYQWYWTNSNQNSGGTAIGGATNPTYSVKATDEMDGR